MFKRTLSLILCAVLALCCLAASAAAEAPIEIRPNGPPRLPGHDQGNGSNAAVEVQHRLPPCQPRKGQRPAIQNLRLLPVHLVKGGHGEPEGQAA